MTKQPKRLPVTSRDLAPAQLVAVQGGRNKKGDGSVVDNPAD